MSLILVQKLLGEVMRVGWGWGPGKEKRNNKMLFEIISSCPPWSHAAPCLGLCPPPPGAQERAQC